MYYKIENQECEVYKKLHEMRSQELKWEEENKQAIAEKVGLNYSQYLGRHGQQTFGRVSEYSGFWFTEPKKVDYKVWKRDPKNPDIFIPNKRSTEGKEMAQFLRNGLKGHYFSIVFKILGIKQPMGRFSFPFVEICGDAIIILLGNEAPELTDQNIVEITKREFYQLMDSISKTAVI